MDYLALVGLALGLLAVLTGQLMEGGSLSALMNGPAFLIVFGGTLGATILQSRLPVFMRSMHALPTVFKPLELDDKQILRKVMRWSNVVRKEGFLGLEPIMNREKDLFTRKALTYLVDGITPDNLRDALELEISLRQESEIESAKVFLAMGGYSPTIGIIGAVMGLIHVMHNLAEPEMLGAGIATAFIATIYGVGFANLIFLPIYNKLRSLTAVRCRYREMLMEGVVAIAEGENPRFIELKLKGFQT